MLAHGAAAREQHRADRIEALAAVLGGTQSLHTNALDEVLALPTEKAAEIALRTQQVIAYETGVANVIDPLGGSYFVEALTDGMEAAAEAYFDTIREMGGGSMLEGMLAGIERGYFQSEIAEAAYREQMLSEKGRLIRVGVNEFVDEGEETDRHADHRSRDRGAPGGRGSRVARGARRGGRRTGARELIWPPPPTRT